MMVFQNKVFWKIFLPDEKLLILQLYIIALGIESAPFILWSSLASQQPKVRWYKSIFCLTFGQLFVIGSSSLYLVKLFFRHHFVIHNHLLWQTLAGQDGQNPKQFTLCIFRPSRVDSSASENFFHTLKTYDFYKLYLFTQIDVSRMNESVVESCEVFAGLRGEIFLFCANDTYLGVFRVSSLMNHQNLFP